MQVHGCVTQLNEYAHEDLANAATINNDRREETRVSADTVSSDYRTLRAIVMGPSCSELL